MKKLIIMTVAFLFGSTVVFSQAKAGKIDKTQHKALYVCPTNSGVILNDLNECPFCGMDLNLSLKEQIKTQITNAYSCPLYADFTSDRTGRKLNISPKEEMKMRVVGLNNNPIYSVKEVVAKQ